MRHFKLNLITAVALLSASFIYAADAFSSTAEVTFLELGSVKCIPCKMMKPVTEKIAKDYKGKVKVIFHDVWTNEGKPYGQKYGIKGIPTQIFLDKDGVEFFRHTGFLPEEKIVEVLKKHGVEK